MIVGGIWILLMAPADGLRSALVLCLPVGVLLALIRKADAVTDYTGWAGRVSIDARSPAALIRTLAWVVLLLPGLLMVLLRLRG
jgi:hypothetical protein